MESIDKIERIIDNDNFVGFIFWHEDGIGVKNYDDDLLKQMKAYLKRSNNIPMQS